VTLEPRCTNAQYEAAFDAATAGVRARHPAVRRLAFGDLFLEDVRAYREAQLARLGLHALFPLWGEDTRALAGEVLRVGIDARLVCVDTTQLDGAFAGRRYDASLLAALPPSVDPCGERGEFHTFVADGPGFARPVPYAVGETVLRDDRFMYCDLVEAAAG
jgi:diphthamide synthase (EF-2-diphthine--ammonia ligase)